MNMKTNIAVLALMALVTFISGCGGKTGPEVYSISGMVNLDGQPLPLGSMLFKDPAGEVKSYFATIKDGSYSTELQPGKWQVQITAMRESKTETEPSADGSGVVPATEQYLPARYNEKTTLEAVVTSDGENTFNFDLESE